MGPYSDYPRFVNDALKIPEKKSGYGAADLFCGCGGLSLGFEAAGIRTTGYDSDRDCLATWRRNLDSPCRQVELTPDTVLPHADIVIGGPPCQPFSRSGKRQGERDRRNGFPAFISAVRRIRPAVWVCENVPALLTGGGGKYFRSVAGELAELGYTVDWKIVRMARHDVAQNRQRLVIAGHHGGFKFPEEKGYPVTAGEALGELVREVPGDARFLTPAMDAYIARYEKASGCRTPRDLHLDRPARTLTCRNLAGATSDMQRIRLPGGRRRRLTVREAARLQSFPDWFEFEGSEESRFRQIGNAVPPVFAWHLAQSVLACLESGDGNKK